MTKFLLQFVALLFAFTYVQTVDAKKIEVNQAKNIALNFLDDKQVLKTVDIRSPKTVISVHFSYSLPMAMQIY